MPALAGTRTKMPSPTRRPLTIIAVLTATGIAPSEPSVPEMIAATRLTQELIRFETINPPGNETPCARHIGRLLEAAGFKTSYVPMGANRDNLIAWAGGNGNGLPLCFSGHTDVVPLGAAPWAVAPFGGDIADSKIYGRGSSDMKSGVAAFVSAAVSLAPRLEGTPGLVLIVSAGEERGCEGVNLLARQGVLPGRGHRRR